jgi:hypothetical protein
VELIFGAFLVYVALLPLLKPGASPVLVFSAAVPWLIILGLWWALFRLGFPYLAARRFRRDNHCAAHPMRRIVSVRGLRTECETTSSDIQWAGIRGAVETPEFFLFFVTPVCAIQLPKRAIREPSELEGLRRLLQERLGERAKLSSHWAGAAA